MQDSARSFVEGMGAAAAASGLLSPLQGRIFGLLYLEPQPLSLDAIAEGLGQSKSHVSVQLRVLVDWQLVRRVPRPGSRRDHYEATADLWRALCEILAQRIRPNLRQVVAVAEEAARARREEAGGRRPRHREARRLDERLANLGRFFAALDDGLAAFGQGRPFAPRAARRSRAKSKR